jgi:hypothetical protein
LLTAPGLRAAIKAGLSCKKTAIIAKSLFGKAHTVVAGLYKPGEVSVTCTARTAGRQLTV